MAWYEITYYVKDDDGKTRRNEYEVNNQADAVELAKILRDNLGYFPVVVYDKTNQEWVEF